MDKLLELEKRLKEAKDQLNKAKHEDEKEDKKMMADALDRHNEKKHGEAKDKDSAYKDMKVEKACDEMVKFDTNGQWSLDKGEYDATHKEVMNGDDGKVEVGNKSVDDDKGKTVENKRRGE